MPRLILLDLKMPRVDGLEVLRQIRIDPALKIIPVVMLTSGAEESDLVQSYNLSVNSYIVKPVDFDKFVSEVSKLGFYWMVMNKLAGVVD
jgi:two-component system response regulator